MSRTYRIWHKPNFVKGTGHIYPDCQPHAEDKKRVCPIKRDRKRRKKLRVYNRSCMSKGLYDYILKEYKGEYFD